MNDPDNEKIFRELGISSAFSPIGILSLLIEQRIGYDAITNLTPLADGKANLTEITLDAASPVTGKKIQDLDLPESCLIVSVMRDGQVLIPRGGTERRPRDRIGIVSLPKSTPECWRFLPATPEYEGPFGIAQGFPPCQGAVPGVELSEPDHQCNPAHPPVRIPSSTRRRRPAPEPS